MLFRIFCLRISYQNDNVDDTVDFKNKNVAMIFFLDHRSNTIIDVQKVL